MWLKPSERTSDYTIQFFAICLKDINFGRTNGTYPQQTSVSVIICMMSDYFRLSRQSQVADGAVSKGQSNPHQPPTGRQWMGEELPTVDGGDTASIGQLFMDAWREKGDIFCTSFGVQDMKLVDVTKSNI